MNMNDRIEVYLNTPSHLLASTLGIPHACQWSLAKGHQGSTSLWAGWAYYLLQRENLYSMGNLNKKKNHGRIWTLVGWVGERQSDNQGGAHSALSALKSTWWLSISVRPIYREGKLKLCLAKMKQSLPHPENASDFLVWTRFLFCGHTGRITEGFCFGVSLPRTELMLSCVKPSCLAGE